GVFSGTTADSSTRLQQSASYYTSASTISNPRGSRIALPVPGFPYFSPWQWVAVTYENSTRAIRIYEPKKGLITPLTALSNWRRGSFWSIGNRPAPGHSGPARVAEATFYTKSLSELEVMQQFS